MFKLSYSLARSTCYLSNILKHTPICFSRSIALCSRLIIKQSFLETKTPLVLSVQKYSTKKSKGKQIQKPKVQLTKEEIDDVINSGELIKIMKDAVEHFRQDLNDNLNLRLTPSTFEQINVKTQDGPMKLGEIAQVDVKSPNMFLIDLINSPDYVKPVLAAISKSNLSVNPQLDKTTIYLPIAKVTREHRESMAKSVKLKCEQALKKMRDAEGKAMRKAKDAKHVSKDLIFGVNDWIKYQFDVYSQEAHNIRDSKTKEILQE
ncbi:unnamed protein product [Brachionus calyciflorus]|uniref:Ribosome-recycling factor, mitochondrial n=1 Tax=Brachionus calyciflorus TaxID=104777 RepID=A0A813Q186_9BILA|nr:unnamed protein product [Brachionus calyciflorus]